ncbi:MAG: hypothetical protein ABH884_00675 [Candidatus Komeilibacteria bacterium]
MTEKYNPFQHENAILLSQNESNQEAHNNWPQLKNDIKENIFLLYLLSNLAVIYCLAYEEHDEDEAGEIVEMFEFKTMLSAQLIQRIGELFNIIIHPDSGVLFDDIFGQQIQQVLIRALHSKYETTRANAYFFLNLNYVYLDHQSIETIVAFEANPENQQLILDMIDRIAADAD